jgi:N-acetylglucosaminyldiphosphoundecaprenol N-acetyl-beta-D-mannosaminyltransferase
MQINQLIHFPISTGTYSTFIKNIVFLASNRVSSYICVANVHMFIEAYKDIEFDRIIKQSDIVTPDGLPITWGLKFINGIKQERVAGMDLLPDLLLEMANQNLAAYFYGGSPSFL